jgi:long-chain acyl-CoA synthetase
MRHDAVQEVSVVGSPDPEWGESVLAFVVLKPGARASEQDLDRLCLESIARFKRPKRYVFLEELPKNSTGKVLKRELQQRALPTP